MELVGLLLIFNKTLTVRLVRGQLVITQAIISARVVYL